MKNKILAVAIGSGLLVLISLYSLTQGSLTSLNLSNRFFLVGLPFLIIGILLWIFSSGFFDHFHYSMQQTFSRKKDAKTASRSLTQVGTGRSTFWLIIAAILIAAAVLCSIFATI